MAIYEVYLPPQEGMPEHARWPRARLVRDGLAPLALFIPLLWLLWHRLWFAFAVYLLLMLGFFLLDRTDVAAPAGFLALIPNLYLFLEGRRLIAARLERQGWRLASLIEAPDLDAAEQRLFSATLPPRPPRTETGPMAGLPGAGKPPVSTDDRPDFGLFAENS